MWKFELQEAIRRRAARRGLWGMIVLALFAISWRIAEPNSQYSEAACFAMYGFIVLFLGTVPKCLWNSRA